MRETYAQFALYAVAMAVTLSLVSWAVEFLLRRRVGVYLAWGLILATTTFTAFSCYDVYTRCQKEMTLSNCEWNPVIYVMALNVMLLTIPLLFLSTIKLKKWSDTRKQRLV